MFDLQKNVVRFNLWINPVFDTKVGQAPGVDLKVLDLGADEASLQTAMAQAHVYHVSPAKDELPQRWQVNDDLLAQCRELLCVSSGGAGHDTVDVAACTRRGIAVVNQRGINSSAVAEMTLGLMLAVSRRIVESDNCLRTRSGFTREALMGHDLRGKTLGLVGMGYAGTATARLANAFGMQVLAYDPYVDAQVIGARGAEAVALDALLERSDIVSLHCPRDASTLNLFDAQRFSAMRAGSLFISTARGGIHDELALYEALQSGHLAGAGLDVWQQEPPALEHPLLTLPNVVATYHTAGVSHEGRYEVASQGADQVLALLAGGRPDRLVNPEVWPHFQERYQALLGARQPA